MYRRAAEIAVKETSKDYKVLLLSGPRQSGKTTLLKSLIPAKMEYITLDNEVFRNQAIKDPRGFLKEHPAPLFIDEVQYAPALFSAIKEIVDLSPDSSQFWLTGSQQFHLMKSASESLAGRVGIINLNSFTYSEFMENPDSPLFTPTDFHPAPELNTTDLFQFIFRGGFPRLYEIPDLNQSRYFQNYIDTYLTRDVRNLSQVGNLKSFQRLLVSVATRTGEELRYASVAEDAGVSIPTAQSWVSILEASGLVYLLEPYRDTELKRLTHMPKIIFMDTGLAAYLAGWKSARELQDSKASGHFLETLVISEIVKSYQARGLRPQISYYRDRDQKEIDLVFFQNNTLYPFEIKKTATPSNDMLKNFQALSNTKKTLGPGGIICFFEHLTKINEKDYIIPVSSILNPS